MKLTERESIARALRSYAADFEKYGNSQDADYPDIEPGELVYAMRKAADLILQNAAEVPLFSNLTT